MEKKDSLSVTEIKSEPSKVGTIDIDADMENEGVGMSSPEASEQFDVPISSVDKIKVENLESENAESELESEDDDSYMESGDEEYEIKVEGSEERDVSITAVDKIKVEIPESENAESELESENAELELEPENAELELESENDELWIWQQCCDCGCTYRGAASLQSHRLPQTCEECRRVFRCAQKFTSHQQTHKLKRQHQCADCGRNYKLAASLKSHTLHQTCSECHLVFTCDRRFSDHKKTHRTRLQDTSAGKSVPSTIVPPQTSEIGHFKLVNCTICGMKLSTKNFYLKHMRMHERVIKCNKCNQLFESVAMLMAHSPKCDVKQTSAIGHFKLVNCTLCGMKLSTRNFYLKHMRLHERVNKCNKCNQLFESVAMLMAHSPKCDVKQENEMYMCKYCKQVCRSRKNLNQHMSSFCVAQKPPSAKDLDRNAPSTEAEVTDNHNSTVMLEVNKKKYSDKRSVYKCAECDEVFTETTLLKLHMKNHTPKAATPRWPCRDYEGKGEVHCPDCSQTFSGIPYLNSHRRVHGYQDRDKVTTTNGLPSYTCNQCSLTFKDFVSFTSHRESHIALANQPKPLANQPKPLANQPKPLVNQPKLLVNQPKPLVNQPKPVSDAQKGRDKGKMKHVYSCKECGMCFDAVADLMSHRRRKECEKKNDASSNNRTLGGLQKTNASSKKRTLGGFQQSKCKICDRLFRGTAGLMHHMKQVHDGKKLCEARSAEIKCEVCGITTTSPTGMKIHMNVMHGGEPGVKTEEG